MWLALPERSARGFCDVWGHSALRREHCKNNVGDFTPVNHTFRKLYLVHILALISLYPVNTDRCTHMLLSHHCVQTVPHSSLSRIAAAVHNTRYTLTGILCLVAHLVKLAAETYQIFSLKMTLQGLKHVRV
jgi:hypothetical protein